MIIGSDFIFFDTLPSSNTHAANLLKEKDMQEGTIVYTAYQTAGRGQKGNYWESEPGMNLLVSIILYPVMISPVNQFLISMTVSLGISDFIKRHFPYCRIKWPNDIYINNDKIAGILIENSIMGKAIETTIAGIGLNINQKKFFSDAPNPVSLSLLTGKEYNLDICLRQLASDLDRRYKQLISQEYSAIRKEYISQLYRINEWNNFNDKSGIFMGRILNVKDEGSLVIERSDGKITGYLFKEVDFIP